jgi:hypothetical protein
MRIGTGRHFGFVATATRMRKHPGSSSPWRKIMDAVIMDKKRVISEGQLWVNFTLGRNLAKSSKDWFGSLVGDLGCFGFDFEILVNSVNVMVYIIYSIDPNLNFKALAPSGREFLTSRKYMGGV